jgi:hypothetical protein
VAFPALLWLTLSAPSQVFIASSLDSCGPDVFAQALKVLRPDLSVGAGRAPAQDASVQVSVAADQGIIVLTVTGHDRVVARQLPGAIDCEAARQTAALIVDRAIEDFDIGRASPTIEALAQRSGSTPLLVSTGATLRQGILGAAVGPSIRLELRLGIATFGVAGTFLLPNRHAIGGGLGTYSARDETLEVTGGFSPRVGPGRLTLAAAAGVGWTILAVQSDLLFQRHGGTAGEPYGGMQAAYALDLPACLFLVARVEEQLALGRTIFVVEGEGAPAVETRAWTAQASLLLGCRLF